MDLTKELASLTREQLYEKVWSTPCSKLAEEFGLSDVAIAKRCKKLEVFFAIEEELVAAPARATGRWRRPAYSAYGENQVPGGTLTFKINSDRYGRDTEKQWRESKDGALEEMLVKVVGGIRTHFVQVRKQRVQDAIDG